MASGGERIRRLQEVVPDAEQVARRLLDELAERGHPETDAATMIFQHLTAISIALFDVKDPPDVSEVGRSLAHIARMCTGALATLRSHVERAAAVARE